MAAASTTLSAVTLGHGRTPLTELNNKIVLIGTSALGLLDMRATPVGEVFPGVEIHANMIAGILDQNLKQKPPYTLGAEVLILLLFGVALSILLPLLSPMHALLLSCGALLTLLLGNFSMWHYADLAYICTEMGITNVIRGQDHLTNTHKQILIYQALEIAPPRFAHLPLILAPNKGKLSKRKHGAVVSMTTYRDKGFIAAAFRNFLALLGWSSGDEQEILSLDELTRRFTLEGIVRSNAVFNFSQDDERHWTDDKALWMNAEYIRAMPLGDLLPLVKNELRGAKLWREEYDDDDAAWFAATVNLIRQRFFTLKDFSAQGRAYFSDDFDFDAAAVAKNLIKDPRLREWLPLLGERLAQADEPLTAAAAETVLRGLAEESGVKAGLFINGARTLLTGQAVGPSMFEIFVALGRDRSVTRLRSQIAWNL